MMNMVNSMMQLKGIKENGLEQYNKLEHKKSKRTQ